MGEPENALKIETEHELQVVRHFRKRWEEKQLIPILEALEPIVTAIKAEWAKGPRMIDMSRTVLGDMAMGMAVHISHSSCVRLVSAFEERR